MDFDETSLVSVSFFQELPCEVDQCIRCFRYRALILTEKKLRAVSFDFSFSDLRSVRKGGAEVRSAPRGTFLATRGAAFFRSTTKKLNFECKSAFAAKYLAALGGGQGMKFIFHRM